MLGRVSVLAGLAMVVSGVLLAAACSSFSGEDDSSAGAVDGLDATAGSDASSADAPGAETSVAIDASPNECDSGPGARACDERYLFVTNGTLPGGFAADAGAGMALALADQFCTTQANGQSRFPDLKNRRWHAWLCTTAESATGRAATAEARYITPEGTMIFPTVAALRSGISSNPISSGTIWTGCNLNGEYYVEDNCLDWTSGATEVNGSVGVAQIGGSGYWQSYQSQTCSASSPIYCFEQSP